ncbi:hypothetical protein ACQ4PT_039909 [Festuca glaucescens]
MAQKNVNILGWNPRGLNDKVHRNAVRDLVKDTRATIVCLQEMKLAMVDAATISYTLVPCFTANYAVLPAIGTRGGMILACSDAFFTLSDIHTTPSTLSAVVTSRSDDSKWSITCVYGPQGYQEKLAFIGEDDAFLFRWREVEVSKNHGDLPELLAWPPALPGGVDTNFKGLGCRPDVAEQDSTSNRSLLIPRERKQKNSSPAPANPPFLLPPKNSPEEDPSIRRPGRRFLPRFVGMAPIPAFSFFFLDLVFSLPCCVLLLLLVDKDPLRRPEPEPPGPVANINFFPDAVDSFFSLTVSSLQVT